MGVRSHKKRLATLALVLVCTGVVAQNEFSGDDLPEIPTPTDDFVLPPFPPPPELQEVGPPLDIPTPPPPAKACRTELSGEYGIFATENFPDNYAENSNCTWDIAVQKGRAIKLTFHLLNMEHSFQCQWDRVTVFDTNGTLIKRVCGTLQQDLVIYSSGSKLKVHFYSDSVAQFSGFLASWAQVPIDRRPDETTDSAVKPGYVFSFPQSIIQENADAKADEACLQLIDVKKAGRADVKIFSGENILSGKPSLVKTIEFNPATDDSLTCFGLLIPEGFKEQIAIVAIEGTFGDYNFVSYKPVRALKTSTLSMIQTDKHDYRPGQAVKFRVLVVDSELRPSKLVKTADEVYVEDPQDNRIAQWKNVALTRNGIAQLSMQLDKEPVLGRYVIKAEFGKELPYEEATFTVSESVLPKFEVSVEGPKHILLDTDGEAFKVCATYTHGGQVKGAANVTFHTSYTENYWRAPEQRRTVSVLTKITSGGCASVKLNGTELRRLAQKSKDLKVMAIVEEGKTETKQNATFDSEVVSTAFKISFVGSSGDHIVVPNGGFPYVGKLRVVKHDGKTPMADTALKICARLFTSLADVRDRVTGSCHLFYNYDEDDMFALGQKLSKLKFSEVCDVYRTASDGTIKFSSHLGAVPSNITKLGFKAWAVDQVKNETTGMLQPTQKHDVALTHSNATTALTIHHPDGKDLDCGANEVQVYLSGKPSTQIFLTWFFTSGGVIVDQGEKSITVPNSDSSSEYVGDAQEISVGTKVPKKSDVLTKQTISLSLPLRKKISKVIKLLVYSRDSQGNILTATESFGAKTCEEAAQVRWSKKKTQPGSSVTLRIEGGPPNAVCGYSVVDKSVDLVGNPNKITKPRLQELLEELGKARTLGVEKLDDRCNDATLLFKAFERQGLFVLSDKLLQATECDRFVDATSKERERTPVGGGPVPIALASVDASGFGGGQPLADISVAAFPPAAAPPQPFAAATSGPLGGGFQNKQEGAPFENRAILPKRPSVDLRNYFPETWLFDLADLDESGVATLDVKAPHSITTWVAGALCSDRISGLSASEESDLLVTQDFFADLILPYSVKRGEVFPLNVSVFNNVDRQLPVRLTVKQSDAYKLGESEKHLCVGKLDNTIENFVVKARELNEVNVTVAATLASKKGCGNLDPEVEGYTDALRKPIRVKPEGFPIEQTRSEFVCKNIEEQEIVTEMEDVVLPGDDDLVDGSERAWITVTGDIMAPALSNLEKLVQVPTGCGEQNMMSLVPNIYLLHYLQGKGVSKPVIESKAKKHMKLGYERQQKYRFKDGSYSAWGPETDDEGSMWLTSFVVKAFAQAANFIEIDQNNLVESVTWILSNQDKSSGCFNQRGFTIHRELKGSRATLTASVLVTLIELQSIDPERSGSYVSESIKLALKCIRAFDGKDASVYNKAMVAYATSLYASTPQLTVRQDRDHADVSAIASSLVNELIPLANDSIPGKLFWTTGKDNKARDVEVTAYMVLTLVIQGRLAEALKTIRWMATQRNSRGGFVSTQDTMVALQAIARYSSRIFKTDTDLSVSVAVRGTEEENQSTLRKFSISEENELLLQRDVLETLSKTTKIQVTTGGKGCMLVQSILRYNVKSSPDKEVFQLTATQSPDEELNVCASYNGERDSTDMVVMEIELLSGFEPVISSLEELASAKRRTIQPSGVKKYEYEEKDEDGSSRIFLYFDQMAKEKACWKIEVKRQTVIEELKPAVVKIYDYYDPKESFTADYKI